MKKLARVNEWVYYEEQLAKEELTAEALFDPIMVKDGMIGNPLMREFLEDGSIEGYVHKFKLRDDCVKKYAWAIPTPEAIRALRDNLPIFEVGAGSGYWARMVVEQWDYPKYVAYDPLVSHAFTHFYYNIRTEEPAYNGETLFFCWPSYEEGFAAEHLESKKPEKVIYIGEGGGGCTGDDRFHEILDTDFEEIESINILRFSGMHDRMYIYRRK